MELFYHTAANCYIHSFDKILGGFLTDLPNKRNHSVPDLLFAGNIAAKARFRNSFLVSLDAGADNESFVHQSHERKEAKDKQWEKGSGNMVCYQAEKRRGQTGAHIGHWHIQLRIHAGPARTKQTVRQAKAYKGYVDYC